MSHASHLFLDHPYEHDKREAGLFWATPSIDTQHVFSYHLPPAAKNASLAPRLLRRLCDMYQKTVCPNFLRPDNIVGKMIYLSFTRSKHKHL